MLISGKVANDRASDGFGLYHWQGPGGKLTRIGEVPKTAGRLEGLLVLDESACSWSSLASKKVDLLTCHPEFGTA
jgi:hypothetical protein